MSDCKLCTLTRRVVLKNDHWSMAVNENQATLGRVFFALSRHETDVTQLTADEVASLWSFLAEAKHALVALFAPDHFNYLFHMNIDPHVHMHIYPRYAHSREFHGQEFADNHYGDHYDPQETHRLDEPTEAVLISALRHEMTQPSRGVHL